MKPLGSVSLSLLVASVTGYGLLVLCGRTLGPETYTTFLSFWAVIFGLGSALSPIEQEVSRQSAEADAVGGHTGGDAVKVVCVGATTAAAVGSLQLLPAVSSRLYEDHAELAVITIVGGVSYALLAGTRGVLLGHQRVGNYAALIILESGARLLLAATLVLVGLADVMMLAIAVLVGTLAWLLFLPSVGHVLHLRGPGLGWVWSFRRTAQLMASSALAATLVTGFPAMINLLTPVEDPKAVGGFLSALTLARLPLIALLPLQTLAVPAVVRLSRTAEGRHRLSAWMPKGLIGMGVLGAVGALMGAWLGPPVVTLIFGPEYLIDSRHFAWLIFSSTSIAAMQLLTAILVARGRATHVLATWAVAATVSVAALVWWNGDSITRATVALNLAPIIGISVAWGSIRRDDTRHRHHATR